MLNFAITIKEGSMSVINIDELCSEMESTMKNNFRGSPLQRFNQAKNLMLASVADAIEDNKKELLKV